MQAFAAVLVLSSILVIMPVLLLEQTTSFVNVILSPQY